MATQRIVIDNIFGGHATSFHFSEKGQYLTSIAVDPDVPTTDTATDIKTAGILRPVGYSEFSGATMDQIPLWISAYPKGTSILVYASGGDIYTYDSSFGSAWLLTIDHREKHLNRINVKYYHRGFTRHRRTYQ